MNGYYLYEWGKEWFRKFAGPFWWDSELLPFNPVKNEHSTQERNTFLFETRFC